MQGEFIDRLQLLLLWQEQQCGRPTTLDGWHASLRRELRGGTPNRRTTHSWIDPRSDHRAEPKAHFHPLIDNATLAYFGSLSAQHTIQTPSWHTSTDKRDYWTFDIDRAVEKLGLDDMASLSRLTVPALFPTRAFSASPLYKIYYPLQSTPLVADRECLLINSQFYLYRSRTVYECVYRDLITFRHDAASRLICDWHMAEGSTFEGVTYVRSDVLFIHSVRSDNVGEIDVVNLVASIILRSNVWPSIVHGTTTDGNIPAAARSILVRKLPDDVMSPPGELDYASLRSEDKERFIEYVDPCNKTSPDDQGLLCHSDFLGARFRGKRHPFE